MQYGPWTIRSSRHVYVDPWVQVRRDEVVRPDGKDGSHCLVAMKAGVSVLALDDRQQVYLTDEFHYAIGRNSIEAVSGGIEPGETADETARRELQEELGITASDWLSLGAIDPFTSIVLSPTALYLARGLQFGAVAPEGTERIRTVSMSLDEAVRAIEDGRITHGPTCVLLLRAARILNC